MLILAILSFVANPFYAANFTPVPIRSISVFSNPAGLGIQIGAEAFGTYHQSTEAIAAGASAGNLGFGYRKVDTLNFYEVGVGYKLPGAFSLGYAYDFGDTSSHILGIQCRPSEKLSLGYKTTLAERKYMYAGIGIMPYFDYVMLNFEIEYEGIDDLFTYYFGARIQPYKGISACFMSDKEFNWHAGVELSFGYLIIAGLYSYEDEKLSAGVIMSAQKYPGFMP
jgi:hypothetical protein